LRFLEGPTVSKKTLIFVDGQNLFYSLKDMGIQEVQIRWDTFFDALLEGGDELIRVYWYQPQKFTGPKLHFDNAKRYVQNQAAKTPAAIDAEANALLQSAQQWSDEQGKRYEGQLHRYDELSIKFPVIEMVRRGVVRTDPFKQIHIGEKGVDVAIAVNMIKFHDKCDKLILVSGDLDYAEAIQFVKDNLKKVHIVRLFQGQPPINRSVSRTLMALADRVIDIYETEIRAKHLI
jgi:uncharacterized LabA/DUF88 family protein